MKDVVMVIIIFKKPSSGCFQLLKSWVFEIFEYTEYVRTHLFNQVSLQFKISLVSTLFFNFKKTYFVLQNSSITYPYLLILHFLIS